jgi:hypothetical protein
LIFQFRYDEPAIFVIGTGRCGTTLLTDLIQGERVHCLKEREVKSRIGRDRRHLFYMLYSGELSEAQFLRHFRRLRRAQLRELPRGELYCEKIPHGQWAIEPIRRVFPQARFIEIYRDGRDTVQSMTNVNWYGPGDDMHRWSPRGDLADWNRMTQFEKCCLRLARTIPFTVSNMATRKPDEYLCFSYEALMADCESHLKRMESFIGQPLHRGRVELKPSRDGWRSWSAEQLATFERTLGPTGLALQEVLGYRRATVADLVPASKRASKKAAADRPG